jgi:hypothetical protein
MNEMGIAGSKKAIKSDYADKNKARTNNYRPSENPVRVQAIIEKVSLVEMSTLKEEE